MFGALSGSIAVKAAPVSASWDCRAVIMDLRFAADHWISASMAADTTTEHPDEPTIADECCVATICIDGTGEYPASEIEGAALPAVLSVKAPWTA